MLTVMRPHRALLVLTNGKQLGCLRLAALNREPCTCVRDCATLRNILCLCDAAIHPVCAADGLQKRPARQLRPAGLFHDYAFIRSILGSCLLLFVLHVTCIEFRRSHSPTLTRRPPVQDRPRNLRLQVLAPVLKLQCSKLVTCSSNVCLRLASGLRCSWRACSTLCPSSTRPVCCKQCAGGALSVM